MPGSTRRWITVETVRRFDSVGPDTDSKFSLRIPSLDGGRTIRTGVGSRTGSVFGTRCPHAARHRRVRAREVGGPSYVVAVRPRRAEGGRTRHRRP